MVICARALCLALLQLGGASQPEQVHLALGKTDDAITVAWVTTYDEPGQVLFGTSAEALTSEASGDSRAFTQDPNRTWYSHMATMTGLKLSTKYFYKVVSSGLSTEVFHFTNRRQGAPYRHLIFGDLGASCAFSICDACTAKSYVCNKTTCAGKTKGLVSEVDKADHSLHLGDFAYNLGDDGGTRGDQFMRNIEQVGAYIPYQVSHGNHEDSSIHLAHYIERFRSQPSNAEPPTFTTSNGETVNTMYFSWDYGLMHYISVSTELWFGVKDDKTTKDTFLAWVEKDLEAANKNREAVPWIMIEGHRSVYCSCDGDCDSDAVTVRKDLEPIMMKYGVDFYVNGHEHNYERSYPLYNRKSDRSNVDPKAPIYIVSGAAGSQELHEPFTRLQPSWSAFRSNSFGYSVATIYNSTHLRWQQVQTDPTEFPESDYGRIIDDAWIIQHKHGPFDVADAPKGEACGSSGECGSRQYDHWWPIMGLEDNSGRSSDEIIRDLRGKNGEKWWAQQLEKLMDWTHKNIGWGDTTWRKNGTVIWEDVSDDGSSDKPPPALFSWHSKAKEPCGESLDVCPGHPGAYVV